jgi:hypothetical protein
MNYIMHTLTAGAFIWVMLLQVLNLVKYRETNGAMKTRLVLMGICITLCAHTIRFFKNPDSMFFMFFAALGFMWLYDGFSLKVLKKNSPPPEG